MLNSLAAGVPPLSVHAHQERFGTAVLVSPPQGMQVVLAKEGICHHLMLVPQARYTCCGAFFWNPLFASICGLIRSHFESSSVMRSWGFSPHRPFPSHPWPTARASQQLAELSWRLRGCVSREQKAWNLQAGSSLLRGVLPWQPHSSWLWQQLCEHQARNVTGDRAWHSSAGSLQQGALVAPVWGVNTSPTHCERDVAREILVVIVLWWWGAAVPAGALCKELGRLFQPPQLVRREGKPALCLLPPLVQQLPYREQRPLILPVFFDLQFSQL